MAKTKKAASNTIPFAAAKKKSAPHLAEEEHSSGFDLGLSSPTFTTIKETLNTGLYNAAFGISYGLVFSAVFLTELLPVDSTLRRGLEEGADAALEATSKPADDGAAEAI